MADFVERRRYFRVEDKLELAFRIVREDDAEASLKAAALASSQLDNDLEQQIRQACQQVSQKAPEVAELFTLLNRKVNQLIGAKSALTGENQEQPREQLVNLSACGIAFIVSEPMALGTRLLLTMRLQPAHYTVAVPAYVIGCETLPADAEAAGYMLRADFANIHDEHQELLIQHVMQCQAKHLRDRRHLRS